MVKLYLFFNVNVGLTTGSFAASLFCFETNLIGQRLLVAPLSVMLDSSATAKCRWTQ